MGKPATSVPRRGGSVTERPATVPWMAAFVLGGALALMLTVAWGFATLPVGGMATGPSHVSVRQFVAVLSALLATIGPLGGAAVSFHRQRWWPLFGAFTIALLSILLAGHLAWAYSAED